MVFTMQVPVPELKEQIASVTGVVSEQQRLICRGKVLKDDQLLSAYRILWFLWPRFDLFKTFDLTSSFQFVLLLFLFFTFYFKVTEMVLQSKTLSQLVPYIISFKDVSFTSAC